MTSRIYTILRERKNAAGRTNLIDVIGSYKDEQVAIDLLNLQQGFQCLNGVWYGNEDVAGQNVYWIVENSLS